MLSEPLRSAASVGRATPAWLRAPAVNRAPSAAAHAPALALVRDKIAMRPGIAPTCGARPPCFATLLTGHWRIVDRFEVAGRLCLIAREEAGTRPRKDLTPAAQLALERATRGEANKVIALDLEVSQSTVTRLIARALHALRLVDVREAMALARTAPTLVEGEPATCAWTLERAPCGHLQELTPAERDIVERLVQGAPRAAIARERGTSLCTVNTQIAALFVKLRVRSKRELLQRVAAGGEMAD